MTSFRHPFTGFILGIVVCLSLGASCEAEDVRSVRQIMEIKDSWSRFAEAGISLAIQGHIGSRTNNEIHMRHCQDLRFFKRPETNLPRQQRGRTMIKLTGKFTMRDDKPVFEIDKIESTSTFVEQYHARSAEIQFRDPKAWRKLADYTKAEALFNKSEELHALAREAFIQACRDERADLKFVTDEAMSGWIAEMKKFGIGQEVLDEWEHERLWMKWRTIRPQKDRETLLRFANELATKFPAARTPLELPQPKLNEAYQKDPQDVFSQSDHDRRQRLLRLFYMDVTRTEILLNVDADGRNADEIVERLKALLPDDPDLINRYEDLHLTWRFSQLPQASREAAIELSQEFRERKLLGKARNTLEIWLEARLKNWRQEGPRGLVRAAEEYLSLLEDEETARKLLLQAWKLAPGEEDTKSALEQLGYRLHNDRWITTKEYEKIPPNQIEEAIKNGEVLIRMTAGDVRRALGAPTEIRTSISAGRVSQAWIYGEPGTLRAVIHLIRSSQLPVDRAEVIAIGEIKPKTLTRAEPEDQPSEDNNEE